MSELHREFQGMMVTLTIPTEKTEKSDSNQPRSPITPSRSLNLTPSKSQIKFEENHMEEESKKDIPLSLSDLLPKEGLKVASSPTRTPGRSQYLATIPPYTPGIRKFQATPNTAIANTSFMVMNSLSNASPVRRISGGRTVGSLEFAVIAKGRFLLQERLGKGAFGEVYSGIDVETSEPVAIKVEHAEIHQLLREYEIASALVQHIGFPCPYYYGAVPEHRVNAFVMQKLGASLEDLFNSCNRRFSLRTTTLIAIQVLIRIELFHKTGFVHRDIKPGNFLLGTTNNLIHLIDFGLCKRYSDPQGKHIPFFENVSHHGITGTPRYASMNAHFRREQSRRDDLESIGYMLLFFLLGKLPWQGLKLTENIDEDKKLGMLHDIKKSTIEDLSLFQSVPDEFKLYMQYVLSLEFEETPDYSYLRRLFRQLYVKMEFETSEDGVPIVEFDWNVQEPVAPVVNFHTPKGNHFYSPFKSPFVGNHQRLPSTSFAKLLPDIKEVVPDQPQSSGPSPVITSELPPIKSLPANELDLIAELEVDENSKGTEDNNNMLNLNDLMRGNVNPSTTDLKEKSSLVENISLIENGVDSGPASNSGTTVDSSEKKDCKIS